MNSAREFEYAGGSMNGYQGSSIQERDARLPAENDELWRYTKPELFPLEAFAEGQRPATASVSLSCWDRKAKLPECVSIVEIESPGNRLAAEIGIDSVSEPLPGLLLDRIGKVTVIRISGDAGEAPLRLETVLAGIKADSAGCFIHVEIEKGARAVVIDDLRSSWNGFLFRHVDVTVGAGGSLNWVSLERMGANAKLLERSRFNVRRDAVLKTHHVRFGSKVSRIDLDARLVESGARAELSAMYHADATRHVDMHPSQIHLAPHCYSELTYRGVMHGHGRAVYCGFIRVNEIAQKTDAYQSNKNLLLSKDARVDSIPNLEIKANDVKCSHGSSSGQVSEEDLFYLQARGISREAAERLLVEGFWTEITAMVPVGVLRTEVEGMILQEVDRGTSGSRN